MSEGAGPHSTDIAILCCWGWSRNAAAEVVAIASNRFHSNVYSNNVPHRSFDVKTAVISPFCYTRAKVVPAIEISALLHQPSPSTPPTANLLSSHGPVTVIVLSVGGSTRPNIYLVGMLEPPIRLLGKLPTECSTSLLLHWNSYFITMSYRQNTIKNAFCFKQVARMSYSLFRSIRAIKTFKAQRIIITIFESVLHFMLTTFKDLRFLRIQTIRTIWFPRVYTPGSF